MSTQQSTDLEKMEKPDDERFSFNDLELLESGQYFDAHVTAGDRTWKVHKSIVCQRSGFMRRAFTPPVIFPVRLHGTTERQAEMLLEYIYSGGIKDIEALSLEDCVDLSILGENFMVDGMVDYGTKKLGGKLKSNLQPRPTSRSGTPPHDLIFKYVQGHTRGLSFEVQLTAAVDKAYSLEVKACQLVLADFVWATRSWLLGTAVLERLNKAHPSFASHILTTFNKGPQTSFFKSDSQSLELQLCEPEPESP